MKDILEYYSDVEGEVEIPFCFLCRADIDMITKEIEKRKKENSDYSKLENLINIWSLNTMYPVSAEIN